MNWEETIGYIQDNPEYDFLVEKSYFDKNLSLNVERFKNSSEFNETLKILRTYKPSTSSILDIGSGNGISVINFALEGYKVDAVEPDKSNLVGSGAIQLLKDKYKLNQVTIHDKFAEDIKFEDNSFDVVYIRQAMHHANDLNKFIRECARVLKPNGLLMTIRDHVVYNEKDKKWFLDNHPLHKFYGGENAFSEEDYSNAMIQSGLEIQKVLRFYDSEINYYPMTDTEIEKLKSKFKANKIQALQKKIGILSRSILIQNIMFKYLNFKGIKALNEKNIPGRMYSFIAIKK